jgi:hypothetical protein
MKKYTGTIILGFIAAIFGVDTFLSATDSGATISEWFYNFLHNDPLLGFTILIGVFASLIAHFWYFKPKDRLQIKK